MKKPPGNLPAAEVFSTKSTVSGKKSVPGRGLSRVRISIVQEDRTQLLREEEYVARPPWAFWGPRTLSDSIELEVGSETVEELRQGEATLRVEAIPPRTWLRRPQPARFPPIR